MSCTFSLPAGATSCINNAGGLKALAFTKDVVSFATVDAVQNVENWRAFIQEDLTMYVTKDIRNVEPTNPEITQETDAYGGNINTFTTAGSAIVHLKTNPSDFKEMVKGFNGGVYKIIMILNDGSVMVLQNEDNTFEGFSANVKAVPIGVPGITDKAAEFRLMINWTNGEQWEDYRVIPVPFRLKTLYEYEPLGIQADVTTALSSDTATAYVSTRGAYETYVDETLTANIVYSNVAVPSVVVAAGSAGFYDLTVQKGSTPANLVAGDVIDIQLVAKTSDVYTHISNVIRIRL